MRYATTDIIKDETSRRRLSSTIIPVFPVSPDDVYIQTTSNERLDKLAHTFYDDSSLWWLIATCNGLGKGSLIVPRDTRLRIPANRNVKEVMNKLNSER